MKQKMLKLWGYLPSFLLIFTIFLFLINIFCKVELIRNIALGILLLLVVELFVDIILSLINFKGPLDIKTPDGFNQCVHPSVVFFKKQWNNYKYYMAYTPFPKDVKPYGDRWESPAVICSNDGKKWVYPDEIKFIDDLTEEEINRKDWFSDTHLIYNTEKDRLEIYYRISYGDFPKKLKIFRKYSYDGINWSDREELQFNIDISDEYVVSQAVIYKNNKYIMYFVYPHSNPKTIKTAYSDDGINWEMKDTCVLNNYNTDPWHIDCQYIDDIYYLVIYDFYNITLWESKNGIDFNFIKILINKNLYNKGSFYNGGYYRSCLVKDEEKYSIYFSGFNFDKYYIGLMIGNDINNLSVVSCSSINKFKNIFTGLYLKYITIIVAIKKKIFKRKATGCYIPE